MKKITLIVLLSISSIIAKSQEKFYGIGKLKIGSDTSTLIQLAKDNGLSLVKVKGFLDAYRTKEGTYSRLYAGKEYIPDASMVPEVAVFKLGDIKVADITINNICVKYYKNSLYYFNSDYSSELNQAMELKYTDFKKRTERDTVSCINKATGNKYDLEGIMFYSNWVNGDVTATTAIGSYYNDKCQKNILSYVKYVNRDIDRLVSSLETKIKQEEKEKKIQETKSKLSEF